MMPGDYQPEGWVLTIDFGLPYSIVCNGQLRVSNAVQIEFATADSAELARRYVSEHLRIEQRPKVVAGTVITGTVLSDPAGMIEAGPEGEDNGSDQ